MRSLVASFSNKKSESIFHFVTRIKQGFVSTGPNLSERQKVMIVELLVDEEPSIFLQDKLVNKPNLLEDSAQVLQLLLDTYADQKTQLARHVHIQKLQQKLNTQLQNYKGTNKKHNKHNANSLNEHKQRP